MSSADHDSKKRISLARARSRVGGRIAWAMIPWIAVAGLMVILALANPLNRDEDQLIGAALLSAKRPFVDFLHLQTPLQVYLWAPVAPLFVGYGFIAMRIASALMGTAILALVYLAQRKLHVERWIAVACTALLACCYSFQFSSAVIRNDVLPALLLSAGISIAILAPRMRAVPAWGTVALLFGLATSAKVSYALPLAAAGLFILAEIWRGRLPFRSSLAYGAAAAAGLAPTLLAWLAAPEAFIYGVVTYGMTAPFEWYQAQGRAWTLRPDVKVLVTLGSLALGPALASLTLLTAAAVRRRSAETPQIRFLQVMIAAGLIAALLPTPTNFQYVLPALPPLFILLGIKARELLAMFSNRFAIGLMGFGIAAGCGYGVFHAGRLPVRGVWVPFDLTRQAHWIGERLRAAGTQGFVSTFGPHHVLDAGVALDPRFATGLFVFRSSSQLSKATLEQIHAIGVQNLTEALDARPPAAIVVDAGNDPLRTYALAHGYRREVGPFSGFDLYIRTP